MIEIKFREQNFLLEEGESVLNGLLRHGAALPHGCKAGVCQSCLLVADKGTIPAAAQAGLKTTQKQLGCFLSCQCVPLESLDVRPADQAMQGKQAKVFAKDLISGDVLRLRLESVLNYQAGQFLNIRHFVDKQGVPIVRSYSIASIPSLDKFIELHIKVLENGFFSQWALHHLSAGDELQLQGPLGECFYTSGLPEQPLLLVGIGTGLAPLYGIARDALSKAHYGPINLILGARHSKGFYLHDELVSLQQDHPNFNVKFLSLDSGSLAVEGTGGDIYQYVKKHFSSLKGTAVYVCGAASFVHKMKRQAFLSGASMRDIHADAFLPCS